METVRRKPGIWHAATAFAFAALLFAGALAPSAFGAEPAADMPPANYGAHPDYTPALSIHDENEAAARAAQGQGGDGSLSVQADAILPRSYSSVDQGFVTPVKSQGPFGTCWSFGTIAALESSLLAHGQASLDELDLSERHLAYFTYHESPDPLGYMDGDATKPGKAEYGFDSKPVSDPYLNVGGNPSLAMCSLTAWRGAANEDVAPYDELVSAYQRYNEATWEAEATGSDSAYTHDQFLADTALDGSLGIGGDSWHVTGAYQISLKDAADVKNAIMECGGLAVLIFFDDEYCCYDHGVPAHYYYGEYDTNHIVTIVGWDDDYSRDNFETDYTWAIERGYNVEDFKDKTKKPEHDGAWLVKNSYGDDWGVDGYFWLSYEDECVGGRYSKGHAFFAEPADNYDHAYQHDGSTVAASNHVESGGSIANVFTAKGNPGGGEMLEAVSFMLEDVNVQYSVQVYLDPSDPADPTSGSPALAVPVTGATSYEGYYTVKLPRAVPLPEQTRYAVVVTLSHANGESVLYSVDENSYVWDWVSFVSSVHEGESFEQVKPGGSWTDLASPGRRFPSYDGRCVARVKAFTRDVAAEEIEPLVLDESCASLELSSDSFAYTGKRKRPGVVLRYGAAELVAGRDYTVSYANNREVGTARATVKGAGFYAGALSASFAIVKAANPLKLSVQQKSLKASELKKRKRSVAGAIKIKRKGQGKLTYARLSKGSAKCLSVNKKTGAIGVKKGTKKGLYKIRVKVRAAGNSSYKPLTKTVTCKLRVV